MASTPPSKRNASGPSFNARRKDKRRRRKLSQPCRRVKLAESYRRQATIYPFWCKTRGRCGRFQLPLSVGGPSSPPVPHRHPAQSFRRQSRSGDPSCAPAAPLSTLLCRLARCLTSSPGWFQLPEGQTATLFIHVLLFALDENTRRKVAGTVSFQSIFRPDSVIISLFLIHLSGLLIPYG